MYTAVIIFAILVSILLILIVLVQNPKGGGLSSAFGGGSSQMMGVQRTSDFLEKSTWFLMTLLLFLSLTSIMLIDRNSNTSGNNSAIQKQIDESEEPIATPEGLSISPVDSTSK